MFSLAAYTWYPVYIMTPGQSLQSLGWRPFFQAQLAAEVQGYPARVLSVHRGRMHVAHEKGEVMLTLLRQKRGNRCDRRRLGDGRSGRSVKLRARLERFGVFQRKAAGTAGEVQLIAANVDTLFIVTSANRDFNVARLERYLAIAHDAGAFPVVVITKADQVESAKAFVASAAKLSPGLLVEALDARQLEDVAVLRPWCETGQSVALLGSSGVGKSTLINTLTNAVQETRTVREDDQRGRHTTTSRSMHRLPQGGWLIDTPGMRELQLVDVADALDEVFSDVAGLAGQCRFADCCARGRARLPRSHGAIEQGELDAARLLPFPEAAIRGAPQCRDAGGAAFARQALWQAVQIHPGRQAAGKTAASSK